MATMFARGFADLEQEVAFESLPVTGAMPTWPSGALVRTSRPSSTSVTLNHWLDGLAMLHRFAFVEGKIAYANLASLPTTAHPPPEPRRIATDPCRTLIGRVLSRLAAITISGVALRRSNHWL